MAPCVDKGAAERVIRRTDDDLIDAAAGLPAAAEVLALRRQRPKSLAALQGSLQALFSATIADPTRTERLRVARFACESSGAAGLAAYYGEELRSAHPAAGATDIGSGSAAIPDADPRLRAMLQFTRTLIERPIDGDRAALETLVSAGLLPAAIVALGQLVGFLSCQIRVVAGLRAIVAAGGQPAPGVPVGSADAADAAGPAQAAADATAVLNINGFTDAPVRWRAWLPIVDLDRATPDQRAVAEESNYRANPEYFLLLSHQPDILRQRSRAMNAAMYDPRGLSRAERELGAVVTSRINGCVYCAAGHSRLFEQLARRNDTIAQVYADPLSAGTHPRERALIAFAIALTRDPGRLSAADIATLDAAGLSRLEALDLIHSVAMFAWANRLMLNLGEPVFPPGYRPA